MAGRHAGVELEDGEHIMGSQTSFLIILDTVAEDAGEYDCEIIDPITGCTNTTDPATLTVHGPCPADFDNDGAVAPFDLAFLLGHWGPNADHPADLDADGTVGPPDLAILLGNWGPC